MTEHDSPQILALKERYKNSFEEKVQALLGYLADVERAGASLEHVSEMRNFLHKLAGSSGMYGYSDISAASRNAMLMADRVQSMANIDELSSATRKLVNLIQSYC